MKAKKTAESVRMRGIDGARIHQRFLKIAYIEGNQAAAARETKWYPGKPEEYISFNLRGDNRDVFGRRGESGKWYKRATEAALRGCGTSHRVSTKPTRVPMRYWVTAGPRAASGIRHWRWRCAAMRPKRRSSPARPPSYFQMEPLWNAVQLPEIHAAIALQRDQPAKAVELLASASPYDRAYPAGEAWHTCISVRALRL